jgi:hypothetical protein
MISNILPRTGTVPILHHAFMSLHESGVVTSNNSHGSHDFLWGLQDYWIQLSGASTWAPLSGSIPVALGFTGTLFLVLA